jgi:hypothetical protein
VVRLHSEDSHKSLTLHYCVERPQLSNLFRLSADLQTENVISGGNSWEKAKLVLSSRDAEEGRLPGLHQAAALVGDNPWRPYAKVFTVSPQAAELRVELQLARASGTLRARNLSLQAVEIKPIYSYARYALFLLWGLFMLWLLIPVVTVKSRYLFQAGLFVVLVVTLGGILLPGDLKQQVMVLFKGWQHTLLDLLPSLVAAEAIVGIELLPRFDVTKVAHFLLFALLAFVLAFSRTKRHTQLLLDLLMLAAATELLQIFIPGRSALLTDWLIDSGGVLLGICCVGLITKIFTHKDERDEID